MSEPAETVVRAWARLLRAQTKLLESVERDLKAAGLPPLAWYDVLLELHRAGADGLRPHEIEARLLLAQHNVSRLVDRLENAGTLARKPCPEDGRGVIATLTPAGRALLRRMWPVYARAIQRNLGEKLTAVQAASLDDLLGRLLTA